MRTPIQISTSINHERAITTVLHDDNSIWEYDSIRKNWQQLPPIPQDEVEYCDACTKKTVYGSLCKDHLKELAREL